jgi:hypothetical protein
VPQVVRTLRAHGAGLLLRATGGLLGSSCRSGVFGLRPLLAPHQALDGAWREVQSHASEDVSELSAAERGHRELEPLEQQRDGVGKAVDRLGRLHEPSGQS